MIVKTKELKTALLTVGQAVAKKSYLPILENVLITVNENVTLTCTDLEIYIIQNINSKENTPFKITVNYKILSNTIKSIKNETVSINLVDDKLVINNMISLDTIPEDEFPPVEVKQAIDRFRIDLNAIKKIIHCTSNDEARPVLNGMFLNGSEICCTDGFRIAKNKNASNSKSKLIIPNSTLKAISKLKTDFINAITYDNKIQIEYKNGFLIAMLIEGNYPDYNAIFEQAKNEFTMTANKNELLNAVDLLIPALKAEEKTSIELTLSDDLTIDNKEGGKIRVKAVCDSPIVIGLDYRYFMDAIKTFENDLITMKYNKNNTPVLFGETELLMPMHLEN